MNNRSKVKDKLRAELKTVSPAWSEPERFQIKTTNSCIVDKYTGEKPVYLTRNGVEIEEWELPNLPEAYLDQVCWPANTPLDQVANEGLSPVNKIGGRYLKPLNRSQAIYAQNAITSSATSAIVEAHYNAGGGTGHTFRPGLAFPNTIFLAFNTSAPATDTPIIDSLTSEEEMIGTLTATASDSASAFSNAYEVDRITYSMTSAAGSNTNGTGESWGGAGLGVDLGTAGANAGDILYNYVAFSTAVQKTANDSLTVTMQLTFS